MSCNRNDVVESNCLKAILQIALYFFCHKSFEPPSLGARPASPLLYVGPARKIYSVIIRLLSPAKTLLAIAIAKVLGSNY
jgi:hypothetical protein